MAWFHAWLEALAPPVLPEGRLGNAIYYTLGQWPKLSVFLTRGEVPPTNNRCENAIRPFVVGRKGWLFSNTVKGAVASANLYSLVETCKANGIEPHGYLSLLFAQLPHLNTVADFEALLPWTCHASTPVTRMGRISIVHVAAAIKKARAMDMPERVALADEISKTQPHMLASCLVQTRMGVEAAAVDIVLNILLVCYQAMKESGYQWPLISEE
jgi:hypothetical protein